MRITILLATAFVACGATAALAGEACFAPQSDWSFGGADFDNAASLDTHACPAYTNCRLGTPNGIGYALIYNSDNNGWIVGMKQRAIGLGEKLPFGVTTADTPDQVVKKIKAAGRSPGYGRTAGIFPSSVGLLCQGGGVSYQFEFNFNVSHRMTNISETPIRNDSMYVDDPSKSFTPVDQIDQ
jgi:hypothetical protein